MGSLLKILFVAPSIALLSCRPATPLIAESPPIKLENSINTDGLQFSVPSVVETTPPSPIPARAPRLTRQKIDGILFEGVAFDSRTHALQVIDQKNGPGSLFASSREVASKTGAILAINAGFFTPEGSPLGMVISRGNASGAWNSASFLGSGIYRIDRAGWASITRRTTRSDVSDSQELLQAGPLLVENGHPVAGLESTKGAVRSIILTDGGTQWWIGTTSMCDLASLGITLSRSSPAGWTVKNALNLDGGRSTDLYISGKLSGGPLENRSFLNRNVRNFLILKPR